MKAGTWTPQPLPRDLRSSDARRPLVFPTRWPLVWGCALFVVSYAAMYLISGSLSLAMGVDSDLLALNDHAPIARLVGACAAAAISLIGYFAIVRRVEGSPGAGVGGPGKAGEILIGLGIGAVILASSVGLIAALGGYEVLGIHDSPELLIPLSSGIGAAIAEEVLFRGFALRLLDQWLGSWAALALTSIAFGLVHIANPGNDAWTALAISLQAGLLLGAAFLATRRIWLGIGIHVAWNVLQPGLFSYTVDGDERRQGILEASIDGPVWMTGGSANLQGSLVSTAVCLLVTAVLLFIAWKRGNIRPATFGAKARNRAQSA